MIPYHAVDSLVVVSTDSRIEGNFYPDKWVCFDNTFGCCESKDVKMIRHKLEADGQVWVVVNS